MGTTFRPLTIKEQFFEEAVKVNVPYSTITQDLPKVSAAPVSLPSPPDLSGKHFPELSKQKKTGGFIEKYWGYLIAGAVVIGIVVYFKSNNKKKEPKKQSASLETFNTPNN